MLTEIEEVKSKGFNPVVYIEKSLLNLDGFSKELFAIIEKAEALKVIVSFSDDLRKLNTLRKAYVFRYGTIPSHTLAMVVKKKGVVVSGNLSLI